MLRANARHATTQRVPRDGGRCADKGPKKSLGEGSAIASMRSLGAPWRERSDTEAPHAADARGRVRRNVERGGGGERGLTRIASKSPALPVPHRQPRQEREKSGAE